MCYGDDVGFIRVQSESTSRISDMQTYPELSIIMTFKSIFITGQAPCSMLLWFKPLNYGGYYDDKLRIC
jgi:hypothetical protein